MHLCWVTWCNKIFFFFFLQPTSKLLSSSPVPHFYSTLLPARHLTLHLNHAKLLLQDNFCDIIHPLLNIVCRAASFVSLSKPFLLFARSVSSLLSFSRMCQVSEFLGELGSGFTTLFDTAGCTVFKANLRVLLWYPVVPKLNTHFH